MTQSTKSSPSPSPVKDRDRLLREQVIALLRDADAHMPFAEAAASFPEAQINTRPPNVEYTFWHLIEHLRMTQADILEYMTSAGYEEREWPKEYWPARDARASRHDWDTSVASFQRDLEAIVAIVADTDTDLFSTVPSNSQHTILREVLVVADHNAYHIGELGILRQVDRAWEQQHTQEPSS